MRNNDVYSFGVIASSSLYLLGGNYPARSGYAEFLNKYRNIGGPFVDAASNEKFTIYDLRPLRPYAHQGLIKDLSDYYKNLIFMTDAVLIIREGHTGSYDIVKSAIKN